MHRLTLICAALLASSCVDTPTPQTRLRLFPGYCTILSETDGAPGADGIRTAHYDGELLVSDAFDSDVDGDDDQLGFYEYDDRGRLVRYEIDDFADGVLDEIRTYVWSEDDRMTNERWDQGADGDIDVDIVFEHDDEGRRLVGTADPDADGVPNLVFKFAYRDGNLEILTIDGLRGVPDEIADRLLFYAYDQHGNLITTHIDLDADGDADVILTYDYECWL